MAFLDLGDRRTRLLERADGRRAVIESCKIGEAIDAQFQRVEEIAGRETQAQILVLSAGYISPRNMVRAQTEVARQQGAAIIADEAISVRAASRSIPSMAAPCGPNGCWSPPAPLPMSAASCRSI